MKCKKRAGVLVALLCTIARITSNEYAIDSDKTPMIQKFNNKDTVFFQYIKDRQDADIATRQIASNAEEVVVNFCAYQYDANDKMFDELIEIASRCRLREGTIASLNMIDRSSVLKGKTLLLPTQNGLFVTEENTTPLGRLLYKKYIENLPNIDYPCYNIDGVRFYFIANGELDPTQLAFYVDASMKMPLNDYVISSNYGGRISPITGKWKFHEGVDLAAPTGTKITACKNGVVTVVKKMDAVYGNYVVVTHNNGLNSLYAHMQQFVVEQGQSVSTGQLLGYVGQTGLATGPHLHFEIRKDGKAQDPLDSIKREK